MIIMKFLGGLLVLISTSLIGFFYGNQYSNRLNNLVYMEQCIKMLETEIVYGAVPLPEAMLNVYKKKVIRRFPSFSKRLEIIS